MWAATLLRHYAVRLHRFQSTLPVWAATFVHSAADVALVISIHAARVGSDGESTPEFQTLLQISIHAARVGSDHCKAALPKS